MHGEYQRRASEHRHWQEILARVERQLFVEVGVDRVGRHRDQQYGVTVGGRFRGDVRADGAPGAGAVVHEHGLHEPLGHLLGHGARQYVAGPARRERDDQAHELHRIVLRVPGPGHHGEAGGDHSSEGVSSDR